MNSFTKFQLEAMRIVKSDLEYIKKEWGDNIDDDSLRRNSNTLRQLLIDEGGLIFKVLEWLNLELYVLAPNSPRHNTPLENILFYSAGGGKFKGLELESSIMLNRIFSESEMKRRYEYDKKNKIKKYTLAEFLTAPSMIVKGEIFNRIELIKFVANKLGSTHIELDEKKLARMRHLMDAKNSMILADKNAVYFEFLSIGQILVK